MSKQRLTSLSQLPSRGEALRSRAHETVTLSNDLEVEVFALSGKEVKKWEKDNVTFRGGRVVRLNTDTSTARLLAVAIRDGESYQQLFSQQDIAEMMDRLDGSDIARLEKVARRLSGLDDDENDRDGDDYLDDEVDGDESGGAEGNGAVSIQRTPSPTA